MVDDLLPYGRAVLEVYGAVEFIKVAGRAIEARGNRELRGEAESWVRLGNTRVWASLVEAAERKNAWPVDDLTRTLALSPGDASRLMDACGYSFDPASQRYYRLGAFPGRFD